MVSDNMDNIKGLTPKEIHEDMVVTLGENDPSYSMVKNSTMTGRGWKRTPVREG